MLFKRFKRPPPVLKVVEYRPRVMFLWRFLLIIVCFGLWTVGFLTGQWYLKSAPMDLILKEREHLLTKIVEYRHRITDLEIALAQQKIEVDITRSSSERMREDYKAMFRTKDLLEEKVQQYQKVLKPNSGEQGIVMGVLEMSPLDSELEGVQVYEFSIDFFQPVDRRKLQGSAELTLIGRSQDDSYSDIKRINFNSLALEESPLELKFGFVHYQTLSGKIRLPEGFKPESVQVVANFNRGKKVVMDKVFDWTVRESSNGLESQ